MAVKVAINGLGRIGRCVARIISQREDIELVAVNASGEEEMIQYNLRYDSVHGTRKDIDVRDGYIYIGLDQTNDELEKQQTMQRVRKNIMEQRTKEATLQKRIKELEAQIQDLQTHSMSKQDTQMLIKSLNKEKQKVSKLTAQIGHYEQEILELTKDKEVDEAINILDDKEIMMKIKENVEKKVGKNNNPE